MTKKIAVLVADGVEDIDVASPVEALKEAGHVPVIVGVEAHGSVQGKQGGTFTVEQAISEVTPTDFDGLLIPGGYAPDKLRADKRFVDFTKTFMAHHWPIFAICHGPQLMLSTGLINRNYTMTATKTVQGDLSQIGARVLNEPVVVQDQLVTSRTRSDLPMFNEQMLNVLAE